jgi:hypothetical protein
VPDRLLSRLARNAVFACLGVAGIALVLDPGRPGAALGVLGGGVLIGISFAAVALTVRAFFGGDGVDRARRSGPKRAFVLVLFAGHYALLAFVAYVMIARLRLHPIGLLGGVTSFVAAVALEARRPAKDR